MYVVAALRDLRLSTLNLGNPAALAAVLQHMQLTRLWLRQTEAGRYHVLPQALALLPPSRPVLPQLASLFLGYDRYNSAEAFLKALPDPARLTYLGLPACLPGEEVPPSLSALTSLAALNLSGNCDSERGLPLRGLDRLAALAGSLTHLDLSYCRLAAVPDVLSALTRLECLVRLLCLLWVQPTVAADAEDHAA